MLSKLIRLTTAAAAANYRRPIFLLSTTHFERRFSHLSPIRMAEKPPTDINNNNSNKDDAKEDSILDRITSALNRLTTTDEPRKAEQKLSSLDMAGLAEYVPKCKNIILMSGAGISTAAGIPDFRSAGTGLYANLQKYKLPFPEAIFYLDYFELNPNPFYMLCKELMPSDYKPTLCHYFQRLLVEKANVLRVYTQNIDGLEDIARVPADKLIYAHGSFAKGRCLQCRKEYSFEWMKAKIHADCFMACESDECVAAAAVREKREKDKAESKDKSNDDKEEDEASGLDRSIVKPDIVFFGESMPERFMQSIKPDFADCDLLIVMGSSLKVAPFNHLPSFTESDCPRVLINREPAGSWLTSVRNPKDNYRDVFLEGDCDDICLKLAEALGWKEELVKLHKAEHERLDAKATTSKPEPAKI